MIAAVAHLLSTIVVLFNSFRLVRFGEDQRTHEQVMAADATLKRGETAVTVHSTETASAGA
jgi:hypothetical protein